MHKRRNTAPQLANRLAPQHSSYGVKGMLAGSSNFADEPSALTSSMHQVTRSLEPGLCYRLDR